MNADYWRGFHDGQEHERKKAAQVLAFYLESLREVKGIGDTLYQRIVEHINTVDVRERKKMFKKLKEKLRWKVAFLLNERKAGGDIRNCTSFGA